jgi:hypothetical protein
MATLLAFSLVFYKLRIFSDTAQYLTDMIRYDGFAVSHNRFVSVLNQWLPVLLLKMHAPLRTLAMAYSFNYSLVPVLLGLLCMHWLKRPYHALAIMLLVVLMDVLMFYYTVSELQMGLCVLLFYDAVSDYAQETKRWKTFAIVSILLLPTIALSHPTAIVSCVGWIGYRLLKDNPNYRLTGITVLGLVICFIVKKFWFTTSYEAVKGLTWERVRPFGLNYYDGPLARSIYQYILSEEFFVPIILLATIAMLAWKRKYKLIALLLAMVVGVFTLVLINFEDFGTHFYDHYYEHMLQPAMFFVVLMFSLAVAKIQGKEWLKAGLLCVVFIISFAKISSGSEALVARQRWYAGYFELMDKLGLKKAIAGRDWVPPGMIRGSFWSCAWETLWLSSFDGPEKSKTLFLTWDIHDMHEPVQAGDEFVSDSWSVKQNTLQARYFSLGDKPYVILENVVADSVLDNLRWR